MPAIGMVARQPITLIASNSVPAANSIDFGQVPPLPGHRVELVLGGLVVPLGAKSALRGLVPVGAWDAWVNLAPEAGCRPGSSVSMKIGTGVDEGIQLAFGSLSCTEMRVSLNEIAVP